MLDASALIPRLPVLASALIRPLPLPFLAIILKRLISQSVYRHPSLFARLQDHAKKSFLIDPVDLPFVFYLQPLTKDPKLTVHRRKSCPKYDGRIAGLLAALCGMIHGAYDGDALFFSRDIVVEGDTAAVLALRNAIDDCELDLFDEFTALLGPAERFLVPGLQPIVAQMQKRSGVVLRRVEVCL